MKLPFTVASAVTLLSAVSFSITPVVGGDTRQADEDIAGVYECRGTRPDGADYRGIVHIVRHNGSYRLMWTLGPEERHLGVGILKDDVLAVSYFGGMPGVVAYRIEATEDGPRLIGQWTVIDAEGHVFAETLTRLKGGAPPPPVMVEPQTIVVPLQNGRST